MHTIGRTYTSNKEIIKHALMTRGDGFFIGVVKDMRGLL